MYRALGGWRGGGGEVGIAYFTVTGSNEAAVDLVLIQAFLLYYVNHVVVMLIIIFSTKLP